MKHAMRFLVCGLFAAIPLFLLSGCYTQVGTARGDFDEGYDSQTAANDQTSADSTQPGDYDSARREFYNDSYCYPPDYPAYSVGIGFGWAPWYGCGYPWYFYDAYPYYGGFYPYAFGFSHNYGGYYHGGGFGYYGGRGYATRGFGMARTTGLSRSGYTTPVGGNTGSSVPAGRTGVTRGTASTGRSSARGAAVYAAPSSRGRAVAGVSQRNRSGMRGPSSRSAPSGRSGGRGYSSPQGHPAPYGGGGMRGGGGGGSRGGGGGGSRGGGGGGSRGGGGRR